MGHFSRRNDNGKNKEEMDRETFQKAIENSENDFEKNLTYISAGALGLSLAFIEKIVSLENADHSYFLVIGWTLLTITLGLNLVSHLISKHFIKISRDEFDKKDRTVILKIKKRNGKIDCINWITVALLILGISSIVIFSSINTVNMAKSNTKQTQQSETTKKEKFGRTIPVPPTQKKDTTKKENKK
jgi:hypothetical protein